MKLIFFSCKAAEVEQACQALAEVGIVCEVRTGRAPKCPSGCVECTELWLQNDQEAYRAALTCAELGLGFNRRPCPGASVEEMPEENPEAEYQEVSEPA